MTKHADVPKFGDWESDGDVPYSEFFEVVRKGRKGEEAGNPNNPHREKQLEAHGSSEGLNPKDEPRRSRDHQLRASPLRHEPVPHKHTTGTALHRHRHQPSPGSNKHTTRSSPLHPGHQVKPATRVGASSPSASPAERGGHAYASSVAGRPQIRPGVQGGETPEKGLTVPKFGDWDESDPSSADGYTQKFNRVREDKSGSNKATMVTDDTIHVNAQDVTGGSKICCFGWCRR